MYLYFCKFCWFKFFIIFFNFLFVVINWELLFEQILDGQFFIDMNLWSIIKNLLVLQFGEIFMWIVFVLRQLKIILYVFLVVCFLILFFILNGLNRFSVVQVYVGVGFNFLIGSFFMICVFSFLFSFLYIIQFVLMDFINFSNLMIQNFVCILFVVDSIFR